MYKITKQQFDGGEININHCLQKEKKTQYKL